MYYSEEELKEIKQKINIKDYIEKYVKLEKHGTKWFGICPFHREKTPSFLVDENKQIYYCCGCGKGGDIFSFMIDYFHISFAEAVERIGEKKETEEQKSAGKKVVLLEINEEAADLFKKQLWKNQTAIRYIEKRKLEDDTIKKFGIGFADEVAMSLYSVLKGKYTDADIQKSGLISYYKDGKPFNKFSNRLIFPIQNIRGNIIGFGGRILVDSSNKKKTGPKYLNSPETVIFDKSTNLFGLNFAKDSKEDYFILCEGYMDVIAMHQAGFTNAIASLGTALTEGQADLIKRYKNKVVLSYDSDGPGISAAKRAIPILERRGISLSFLDLNPHKDPDEFIKEKGCEAFQERIDHASSLKQWILKNVVETDNKELFEFFF